MQSCWQGFYRTNSTNAIVPKNCVPKTCQMVYRWVVEHASEKLRDWRDVVISHGVLFAFCPVISPAKQLNLTRTQASEMRGMVWHGVANLFIGFKRVCVMETECCIRISRRVENILIKGPDSPTC